jgi:hypothetical protein
MSRSRLNFLSGPHLRSLHHQEDFPTAVAETAAKVINLITKSNDLRTPSNCLSTVVDGLALTLKETMNTPLVDRIVNKLFERTGVSSAPTP